MAQEFWDDQSQSHRMKKFIDLLEKNHIDFTLEGDKIAIEGDLEYADFVYFYRPETIFSTRIVVSQGDNKIDVSTLPDGAYIAVRTPTKYELITLPPKQVHVKYKNSHLIIDFSRLQY